MSRSRRLLKSIKPRADESIQSIAMRLAPLALVTPNELLRFGLGHAAGLASLPTDIHEETFQDARDQICTVLIFRDPKMLRD
jgi:hypothetical protein